MHKLRSLTAALALAAVLTLSITGTTYAVCGGLNPACPSTPILSGSSGVNSATLTWTSATNNAIIYNLKRGTVIVYSGGNTFFGDTGLTSGTSYAYTVQACSADGCGTYSSATNVTPTGLTAPSAPTINCIANVGTATCTWTEPSNTSNYILKNNGNTISNSTVTRYTEENLVTGTSYDYTVQACNQYGCSASSNTETEVPSAAPVITPTEPVTYAQFKESVHDWGVKGAALLLTASVSWWFVKMFRSRA